MILLFLIIATRIAYSQVLLTVKGDIDIKASASIYVKGGMTGSGTGQITNNGDIFIKQHSTVGSEDWTNNASVNFLDGTGTVIFNSGESQNITGTYNTSFHNLTIDNSSSNGVICGVSNNTVKGILSLTAGALQLNHFIFVVDNSSTGAVTRTNGYIVSESEDSKLQWNIGTGTGNYIYPFGRYSTGLRYIPFGFNVTSAGTGITGKVTLATYHTGSDNTSFPSTVTNLNASGSDNSLSVLDRFWIITPGNFTSNPTATLKFNYEYVSASDNEFYSPNTISEADLQAQRWDGTQWANPSVGSANVTSHYVQVAGISTFSPWVLVTKKSPLPVELMSFDVQCEDAKSLLTWVTASETNNDYFIIEKSKDALIWNEIATISGSGNTNSIIHYNYIDEDYGNNIYYRLCQFDFNGKSEYLGITFKQCDDINSGNEETNILISPNPASDVVNIKIKSDDLEGLVLVKLLSAIGQTVLTREIDITKGQNEFQLNISDVNNTLYVLVIESQDGNCFFRNRLVVQK